MSGCLEHRPLVSVGVFGGKTIFVGMANRDDFDAIALPLVDHGENENGHLLSKSLRADGVEVFFQYWLKSETFEALMAKSRRRRLDRGLFLTTEARNEASEFAGSSSRQSTGATTPEDAVSNPSPAPFQPSEEP